jgi:phage shock protein A
MALLDRVATLIRANLNDLIDKAEDPEKLIKQVVLDMENQLIQVKTQLAISMADQHVLEKRRRESEDKAADWMRKAELAVDKKQDDLARAALERALTSRQVAEGMAQQIVDQSTQVDNLRAALQKLDRKLEETRVRGEALIAQHRRARTAEKAVRARGSGHGYEDAAFKRADRKIARSSAASDAMAAIARESIDDRLAALERDEQINRMLEEIKSLRAPQ